MNFITPYNAHNTVEKATNDYAIQPFSRTENELIDLDQKNFKTVAIVLIPSNLIENL